MSVRCVERTWIGIACDDLQLPHVYHPRPGHRVTTPRRIRFPSLRPTQEAAVGKDKLVPFLLETEMKAKGAEYSSGADWSVHAVADGRLITGQNPQSSARVAELVVQALKLA